MAKWRAREISRVRRRTVPASRVLTRRSLVRWAAALRSAVGLRFIASGILSLGVRALRSDQHCTLAASHARVVGARRKCLCATVLTGQAAVRKMMRIKHQKGRRCARHARCAPPGRNSACYVLPSSGDLDGESGLPSPGFGNELDLVPRPHVPSYNYLLAALQPLDRERIYPHLELIPMPLGRFCTNLGTWCITFTL